MKNAAQTLLVADSVSMSVCVEGTFGFLVLDGGVRHVPVILGSGHRLTAACARATFSISRRLSRSVVTELQSKGCFKAFCVWHRLMWG